MGNVKSIRLLWDKDRDISRGTAFIEFFSVEVCSFFPILFLFSLLLFSPLLSLLLLSPSLPFCLLLSPALPLLSLPIFPPSLSPSLPFFSTPFSCPPPSLSPALLLSLLIISLFPPPRI